MTPLNSMSPSSPSEGLDESKKPYEIVTTSPIEGNDHPAAVYRLYKRRFSGMIGLWLLSFAAGMCWPFFGPISNDVARDFDISLDRVNWLGNLLALVYLVIAPLTALVVERWGIRSACNIGSASLLISAWLRYSGTVKSLTANQAYGLLMLGQLFAAVAQPIFQIMAPKYSESWFDFKGRTTATMILAIANPIGGAIGQLISPLIGDTRKAILVLGIISTAASPFVFLIQSKPPTPPTYSAAQHSHSLLSLVLALLGKQRPGKDENATMTPRERLDFAIVLLIFGFAVATTNGWSILTSQVLAPYGYDDTISGLMGATLLLVGIVAAIVTAPLQDRVFTHRLALTAKILVPIMGAGWFSLIWAVRPNNTAALFVIMAVIGACAVTMLPIGQELAVEVTRNAEGSSALLWSCGNLLGVVVILSAQALRASPEADPPLNMKRALIFIGVSSLVVNLTVLALRGEQRRRQNDENDHM